MIKLVTIILLLLSLSFSSHSYGQNILPKTVIVTEIGEIRFDESITNFKQATIGDNAFGKKYIYSLHGKSDLKNTSPTSGFYVAPLKFMDYIAAKKYLDDFANGYGKDFGVIKLNNFKKTETTINNLKVYIITFSTVDKANKKSYVTLAIISNDLHSIEFSGNDFDNGIYSEKFMRTAKSLEL